MPHAGRVLVRAPLIIAAVSLLLAPSGQVSFAGPTSSGAIAYVFSKNLQTGMGELTAFNTQTGAVVNRTEESYPVQQPELLVTPDGSSLYVLEGRVLKGGKALVNTLSLIDTRSWKVIASTQIPQRMQYTVVGPGTLTLALDGSRLFVYSYRVTGPNRAQYWLSVLQRASLAVQTKRIMLPNCGWAYFTAAQGQIAAACFDSSDVRFINVRRLKVVARVRLPSWGQPAVALFTSQDHAVVYVLTVDLGILAISVASHRIIEKITTFRDGVQSVPSLYGAAVNGSQLIAGTLARAKDTDSAFTLRPFLLPYFKPLKPVPLPRYTHLTAAPGGGLFTFPMGDSSDRDWRVQLLSPDLTQARPLLQLGGPVFQLAIPGAVADRRLSGGLP